MPRVKIIDPDGRARYRRELDYSERPAPSSTLNPENWSELDAVTLQAIETEYDSRVPNPEALRAALVETMNRHT